MKSAHIISTIIWCLFSLGSFAQNQRNDGGIWYNHYSKSHPNQQTDFAVKGNGEAIQRIDSVHYKYETAGWHFIRCSSTQLTTLIDQGFITQIYFEPSRPAMLNDTMRYTQNIDSVHMGASPLQTLSQAKVLSLVT
jgi:hypothetical protein